MSYQALARRWRPRRFADVVGQEHVVRALANALDRDRVHHAFLFSGTRGVGKTTLARILAKALNCEAGVSSEPCGECGACLAIDEGRFVDLIEVDAASRTRVDETRELLDNVQYAPTSGRYKVYLIDEVHMLSGHSFNALLKTLEEPPPHVKFLLATTDPQKLPVTVLSRCLQFNLKALESAQIAGQLERILAAEDVEYSDAALGLLARAADGSMRDGLSLLDQAIAFGAGRLAEAEVRDMLGTIDEAYVGELLEALAAGDTAAVLTTVQAISERAIDYAAVVDELLLAFHRAAVARAGVAGRDDEPADRQRVEALSAMSDEDLQLCFQIGLLGKRDLSLAPHARTGFEMTLLRMLHFRPEPAGGQSTPPTAVSGKTPDPGARSSRSRRPAAGPTAVDRNSAPGALESDPAVPSSPRPADPRREAPPADAGEAPTSAPAAAVGEGARRLATSEGWSAFVETLDVNGMVKTLAMNVGPLGLRGGVLELGMEEAHQSLHSRERVRTLERAVAASVGEDLRLSVTTGALEVETPSDVRSRADREARRQAESELLADPNVQELMRRFEATLMPHSVEPGDRASAPSDRTAPGADGGRP